MPSLSSSLASFFLATESRGGPRPSAQAASGDAGGPAGEPRGSAAPRRAWGRSPGRSSRLGGSRTGAAGEVLAGRAPAPVGDTGHLRSRKEHWRLRGDAPRPSPSRGSTGEERSDGEARRQKRTERRAAVVVAGDVGYSGKGKVGGVAQRDEGEAEEVEGRLEGACGGRKLADSGVHRGGSANSDEFMRLQRTNEAREEWMRSGRSRGSYI